MEAFIPTGESSRFQTTLKKALAFRRAKMDTLKGTDLDDLLNTFIKVYRRRNTSLGENSL